MLVPLGRTRSNEAATRETCRGHNEPRRRAKALRPPPYSSSPETQAPLGSKQFRPGGTDRVGVGIGKLTRAPRRRCARAGCSSNHTRPSSRPSRDDPIQTLQIALEHGADRDRPDELRIGDISWVRRLPGQSPSRRSAPIGAVTLTSGRSSPSMVALRTTTRTARRPGWRRLPRHSDAEELTRASRRPGGEHSRRAAPRRAAPHLPRRRHT
jgi:hypothetical protein